MKKEALRVTATIPVAPTTLYFAWLDSDQHSAMTGGAAKFVNDVGQKYSALGGYISGKLIILDLGRRFVMSWRTTDFPRDAADSKVEIQLDALGGSTRVTVLHTDIPEGQAEQYRSVWNDKYFTPMRNYFSKYLPDPRNPPPPRRPPPPPEEEDEVEEEKPKGKAGAKAKGPSIAKVEAKSSKKLAPPAPAPAKKKAAPPPPPAPKKKAAPPPPPAKKPAKKAPPPPAKKAPPPAAKKPAKKPAAKPAKKPAAKKKK